MSGKYYRVIVMGAGSTGSSIAYYLTKKGLSDILVLDKASAGSGQTSRSSALIRLHYTEPTIREMAVYSWRFWRNFQEETGCEFKVFTKVGVAFVGGEEHVNSMENVIRDLKAKNIDVELYDPSTFKKEVYKDFNDDGLECIAWEPDSGYGDPNTSVRCFLDYARKTGAEIMEYNRILGLIMDGDEITAVKTEKGVFKAELYINALGTWANQILKDIGIALPLEYGREDVLYLKNPAESSLPIVWADLALGFYARPEARGYTLVGSLDPEPVDEPDEPGDYSTPPISLVNSRTGPFIQRFPNMIKAAPYSALYGFYDITPDWQPIIGFDDKISNLIHMAGLSGHGFKLAPAYGDVISDIIIHGRSRKFNVDNFSIKRFATGEYRRSKYKYGIVG